MYSNSINSSNFKTSKNSLFFTVFIIFIGLLLKSTPVSAQLVLFDFDNAPLYSSLPLYQTAGGITAHLSATGSGYSIQNANVLGFTPPGFSGHILYPNSIYASDIRVHFDHVLTDFSIMYCPQELGCDDGCRMRVTAFMNGSTIGTNTHTTNHPGTWPVDTLSCSFPQGFDSVIVHYDAPPPTCQDYGVIFLADNMRVTPELTGITKNELPLLFSLSQNYPNPFNPTTNISFQIPKMYKVSLVVYDELGRLVETLVDGELQAGKHSVDWNASLLPSGTYFYRLSTSDFTQTKKMILVK